MAWFVSFQSGVAPFAQDIFSSLISQKKVLLICFILMSENPSLLEWEVFHQISMWDCFTLTALHSCQKTKSRQFFYTNYLILCHEVHGCSQLSLATIELFV